MSDDEAGWMAGVRGDQVAVRVLAGPEKLVLEPEWLEYAPLPVGADCSTVIDQRDNPSTVRLIDLLDAVSGS